MTMTSWGAVAAMVIGVAGQAGAQSGAAGTGATYDQTFEQLWGIAPDPAQGAATQGTKLVREAGTFELESGRLNLLTPVGGRVVAAVWEGVGRFTFATADSSEAARIARFFDGNRSVAVPIRRAVFFFTDSTLGEFRGRLSLGAQPPGGGTAEAIQDALKHFGDRETRYFDTDFMSQVLNGRARGSFLAYIDRQGGGGALVFSVTPDEREGVRLYRRRKNTGSAVVLQNIAQVPRASEAAETWRRNRRGDPLVSRYQIDIALPNSSTGDVSFSAQARATLWSPDSIGPWVPLSLYYQLKVDSASWGDGTRAEFARARDAEILWLRLPRPLGPADSMVLNIGYHGDLTDRFSDFFAIKASTSWYPASLDWQSRAVFDLTFRSPRGFSLASVGERQDSTMEGGMMVTRWLTPMPIRNASFNFGLLKPYPVREDGAPPVTVLWSATGHAAITRALVAADAPMVQEKGMEKRVGSDVAAAMQFYATVFGSPPVNGFYATETPALHGEAFPGLVHLSYVTFVATSKDGADEIFRAHEVAHQWWAIGVDYATYRDRWLSEGFSTFSGLWYLQAVRKESKPYFDNLRKWRDDIIARGERAGPISQGHRVLYDTDYPRDYDLIVYRKGAWVVHMLRALLIDLKTMNEDRFTGVMKDFYQTYRGRSATTQDFQRTLEKHVGQPMDWFFRQWVYDNKIPTYRVSHTTTPDGGGKYRLKLVVLQEGVPDTFQMYVPVTVEFANGQVARLRVLVKGPRSEPELPLMPAEPKSVKFNDFEGVLARVE